MSGEIIDQALVLAAGFGKRMRPLTEQTPKPLIPLGGKPMVDHVLDRLVQLGIRQAIVNVHYLPGQIEAHMASRSTPQITISDERAQLLDTGGAVKNVLPALGERPFIVHNSDSVWIESGVPTLSRMVEAWDSAVMDCLLLLAPVRDCLGYSGRGDFHLLADGGIRRRGRDETAPFVFAGVSIYKPMLFADVPEGPFSLNDIWDIAIAKGRVRAVCHEGQWMHVGTPEALVEAERQLNGLDAA